jgi:hypothetical protein
MAIFINAAPLYIHPETGKTHAKTGSAEMSPLESPLPKPCGRPIEEVDVGRLPENAEMRRNPGFAAEVKNSGA